MSGLRERIRELRKEAAELEPQAADDERREAYVNALQRERLGVEQRRTHALKLGDKHERWASPLRRGEYIEGELSGFEAAVACERQLADIDAELKRVSKEG